MSRRKTKKDLTVSRVKDLLDYDPSTGEFVWKPRPAGHRRKNGYVSIHIDGVEVKAHQLAWFIEKGEWPEKLLDHRNGNRSDNRIDNLRDGNANINQQNQRKAKSKTSSNFLGVAWNKHRNKWQAQISVGGKNIYLGLFITPEDAHEAYLKAKRELHEGCTI